MKKAMEYLWTGLDLGRFAVVAIWPQNARDAVVLMRSRKTSDPQPWCLEYRGSGYYFGTAGEAMEYCERRGFKMEAAL